jgi:hypothetical protein
VSEPWLAMRISNLLLLGLLFYVGRRWSAHMRTNPWKAATGLTLGGVVLVCIAIALGG